MSDTSRQLAVTRTDTYLTEECNRNQASSMAWHTDPHTTNRSVLQKICGPTMDSDDLCDGRCSKLGRLAEYWSRHFYTPTPSFCQAMSCSRFMLILRYLHFVDNEDTTTDRGLRTWKVHNVLDYVCKRFRESLIKFKELLNIKQPIKMKAVKLGVRWFTIVEFATGYVLCLLPYTGKRADTAFGKTTETVL